MPYFLNIFWIFFSVSMDIFKFNCFCFATLFWTLCLIGFFITNHLTQLSWTWDPDNLIKNNPKFTNYKFTIHNLKIHKSQIHNLQIQKLQTQKVSGIHLPENQVQRMELNLIITMVSWKKRPCAYIFAIQCSRTIITMFLCLKVPTGGDMYSN